MIRRLRRRHRLVLTVLAVLLPLLFVLALASRPALEPSPAAELHP